MCKQQGDGIGFTIWLPLSTGTEELGELDLNPKRYMSLESMNFFEPLNGK